MTLHDFMNNTILSTQLVILNQNNGETASGTRLELSRDKDIKQIENYEVISIRVDYIVGTTECEEYRDKFAPQKPINIRVDYTNYGDKFASHNRKYIETINKIEVIPYIMVEVK